MLYEQSASKSVYTVQTTLVMSYMYTHANSQLLLLCCNMLVKCICMGYIPYPVYTYPWQEGYKTHYVPWGRPVLECIQRNVEGKAQRHFQGVTKAPTFPTYRILFIPDLGYSDLRRSGPRRSGFQSALQSPCARTMNCIPRISSDTNLSVFGR